MNQKINSVKQMDSMHWGDVRYGTYNPVDKLRNLINYACSEVDLARSFKRLTNALYDVGGIMAKPIGIVGKNYAFIQNALKQNIGSGLFQYDGYGTPIGDLAKPDLNSFTIPWFFEDENKDKYDNYLTYMNEVFFGGRMDYPNFNSVEDKAKYFSFKDLLLDNNKVGVVRNYNIIDSILASRLLPNGVQTNMNTFLDSKLGIINNFFLNATLNNAQLYYSAYGTYETPTYGSEYNATSFNAITQGSYSQFGLLGDKGMVNGDLLIRNGGVLPQRELTSPIISYTPVDMFYDGDFHNHLNKGKENDIYGDIKTMKPSEMMLNSSSLSTQLFIKKSILGYDLLENNDNIPDFNNTNISVLDLSPKKYKVTLDRIAAKDYLSMSPVFAYLNGQHTRYIIDDISNYTSKSVYAESIWRTSLDGNVDKQTPMDSLNTTNKVFNAGISHGVYSVIENTYPTQNDIISYTNTQFKNGEYDTLIARFHTDEQKTAIPSIISSAVSAYGMSHGRNLLRKDHKESSDNIEYNGYNNPYCRVWTYHHQYSKIKDLIRPLGGVGNIDLDKTIIGDFQPNRRRLDLYDVKNKRNGLVQVAPTSKNDIKKCMFSIENLAWRGQRNKSLATYGQVGPFGGRIMWFPPYDLKFDESVAVHWNPTQFIGRGENIYTYTNTDRSGSLSFKILIDHPSLLNHPEMKMRSNGLVEGVVDSVNDVNSAEQGILRFFAGCEVLKPKKDDNDDLHNDHLPKSVQVVPTNVRTDSNNKITFFVYYPNNYSGVNDLSASTKVSPMEYLLNGIGCQVKGTPNNYTDIGTSICDTYSFSDKKNIHGGYEMGNGGISHKLNKTTHSFKETNSGEDICAIQALNKNKKNNFWGYRVDKSLEDEVYYNDDNYFDTSDYALNLKIDDNILKTYHQTYEGDLYSFAEVYCALTPNGEHHIPNVNHEKVAILRKLCNEFNVKDVRVFGSASNHGYVSKNKNLSKQRAESVIKWLQKTNPDQFTSKNCHNINNDIGGNLPKASSVSSIESKIWKSAKIVISFDSSELSTLQEQSNNNATTPLGNSHTIGESRLDLTAEQSNANANVEQAVKSLKTAKASVSEDKLNEHRSNHVPTEYEFFQEVAKQDCFLHNKVVDKIKYFDPAYHSITPEGFNARLTFLHQCTRQGATHTPSDFSTSITATNLAFGAPPVCILRIGDFYHTKIIIESLQISYDNASWDLNDEGIGVMPMMADVRMSFKFLGGSDLSGPIARLQNAVSFNYYANTSVYENRSDTVEYKNGKIITINNQEQ